MAEAVSIWHPDWGGSSKKLLEAVDEKALVRPIPVNSPVTDP
jgi:hypothetical protein